MKNNLEVHYLAYRIIKFYSLQNIWLVLLIGLDI